MRYNFRSSEKRLKHLILILIASLLLAGPSPLRAEQPGFDPENPPDPADIGDPPKPPPDVNPGRGPGFADKKKKDDDDGPQLGNSLAVLAYGVAGAVLAGDLLVARGVTRRAGDAFRTFLGRPETREAMGPMGTALERLDTAEPRMLGELETAQREYSTAYDQLQQHIQKAVPGPAAANLQAASDALDTHVKALLNLGLLRSQQMRTEANDLIQAWLNQPNDPDRPRRPPVGLEQWVRDHREHVLFTTGPGQRWLAEFERLKGQYALSWWNERHSVVPLEDWIATQKDRADWNKDYLKLRLAESDHAAAYTRKLQEVLTAAAKYTDNPALKARLLSDAKSGVSEPRPATYDTHADRGRHPREPGEFAVVSADGGVQRMGAVQVRDHAAGQCRAYAAFGRAMEAARHQIVRRPILRLTLAGVVGVTAVPAAIKTEEGLKTYLTPVARSVRSFLRPEAPQAP